MCKKFALCLFLLCCVTSCSVGNNESSTTDNLDYGESHWESSDSDIEGINTENFLEQYRIDDPNMDAYLVDGSLVVISEEIDRSTGFFEGLSQESGHVDSSYTITKCVSYFDHWYRWSAYYFPQFSDQIPYEEGRKVIQQYYLALAEEAAEEVDTNFMMRLDDGDTLIDSTFDLEHYWFQTYSASIVRDYLSVCYYRQENTGGSHIQEYRWTDNFDMRTGQLLTVQDVFASSDDADALFQSCILKYVDLGEAAVYTLTAHFYFEEAGVTFFYNPYEAVPFAHNTQKITIPYAELEPILLIDLP